MCLDKKLKEAPPKGEVFAWKIFEVEGNKIASRYQQKLPISRGKWLKAEKVRLFYEYWLMPPEREKIYTSGFHAYVEKTHAEYIFAQTNRLNLRIIKVKLRNIKLVGLQAGFKVYVADEMLIPRMESRRKNAGQ